MLSAVEALALAVFLGVIQGVTEWLPVSSKTIIMLVLMAFGLSARASYELAIALNGATVLSALLYFRRDFLRMLKHSPGSGQDFMFFLLVTLMTALVGVPLYAASKGMASAGGALVMAFASLFMLATGVLARKRESLVVGRAGRRTGLRLRDSITVGVSQGFSALPGVSRSGVTLASLLALGYTNEASLRASFIAGVPASLGGALLALLEGRGFIAPEIGAINSAIMFSAAALTGLLSIDRLTKLALKVRFSTFNFLLGALGLLSASAVFLLTS
jgi:undecaprenyl-diphosphatase